LEIIKRLENIIIFYGKFDDYNLLAVKQKLAPGVYL